MYGMKSKKRAVLKGNQDMNKCCGTCKWSDALECSSEHKTIEGKERLRCIWIFHNKVPDSMPTVCSKAFMNKNDGHYCSCWEKK